MTSKSTGHKVRKEVEADCQQIIRLLEKGPADKFDIELECHLSGDTRLCRIRLLQGKGIVEEVKKRRICGGRAIDAPTGRYRLTEVYLKQEAAKA